MLKKAVIKTTTSSQICCHTTLPNVCAQLYNFTFILARIILFMFGAICYIFNTHGKNKSGILFETR